MKYKVLNRGTHKECVFCHEIHDGDFNESFLLPEGMTDPTVEINDRISKYIANKADVATRVALFSGAFDACGIELKNALIWLITQIRKYPSATVTQASNAWDAQYADSLFDFARLANYVQKIAGGNTTWNNFKTFVINRKFTFIDGEI